MYYKSIEKSFQIRLAHIQGKVRIQTDPTVTSKFFKPWPLPFAIKDKVEDEFKKLQEQGVI